MAVSTLGLRLAMVGATVAACGPARPADRTMVPEATLETALEASRPPDAVEHGELHLYSAGEPIGQERFTIERRGERATIMLTGKSSFPDAMELELTMQLHAPSWQVLEQDLRITRGDDTCLNRLRLRGDVMELETEFPDGERRVTGREPVEHATHYISIRPTITQTAVCVVADDRPHAMYSFPGYTVRTAPRVATEHATADGARRLDKIVVDELIDVYCDGAQLAIVHYPRHAFIAARAEYDELAARLTAPDYNDQRWAGELACPSQTP